MRFSSNNLKFSVSRDVVKIFSFGNENDISIKDFNIIADCVKQSRHENAIKEYGSTDYGYTHICLGCDKYDYIVQGYCRPCFINKGLRYEDDRLN